MDVVYIPSNHTAGLRIRDVYSYFNFHVYHPSVTITKVEAGILVLFLVPICAVVRGDIDRCNTLLNIIRVGSCQITILFEKLATYYKQRSV